MKWFRHVERIEEERKMKRIMRADMSEVRLRRRPQKRWTDTMKGVLSEGVCR